MNVVSFRVLYEDWVEADLDGITVRFRATLGGILEDGPQNFQMRVHPQLQVFAPEDKQRAPRPQTRRLGPISKVVSGKSSSAYEHAGGVLRIYATIVKAFRTDGYDANGEPVFEVEFQQEIQSMAKPNATPQQATAAGEGA